MTKLRDVLPILGRAGSVAVLAIGLSGGAFAMGGDSGSSSGSSGGGSSSSSDNNSGNSSGSSGTTATTGKRMACPKGYKISADQKKCLRDQQSGLTNELPAVGWGDLDEDFLNAAVLAHAGKYREAIDAFAALGRDDDPYVLNYLGYSHRKLGEVETALNYYDRALTLRPDYVRARQYLGEGYLALGRLDDAKAQLIEIAQRCGITCEPYTLLEGQIADYQKSI